MAGPLSDLTPYFLYLLLTATLGPLLFGYHLAELNAPAEVITCAKKSIDASTAALSQCIPMNPSEFGLVSSSFTLGGLLGALSAGPLTTKQGRWRAMLISGVFAMVGPVFEAAASSIGVMAVGRLLSGVGAGMATVVVPIYISEISPPSKRGLFGAFTQIMTNMGILITQSLGYFLSTGQMWRVILGVGGAIAVVQTVSLALVGQESPQWLADHGNANKAKRILQKIRGHKVDIDDEVSTWSSSPTQDLNEEEETLLASNNTRQEPAPTIGAFAVLNHPDYRYAVFAVVMIMIAQQFTGINSIVMYGVSLLSDLLAANAALLNVAVAAVNVVITASCAPLVDRLGRKTCLLSSIAGMGVSSLLLALGIMRSIPILSAIAVILFVASFGFGLGPIPFILASELVNSEAVGATQSWALAANWIATFVVAQFFPLVNQMMGKGQVYFLFAGFALAFGSFVAWYVPETMGKRDADEIWGRKKAGVLED
jgi:sugar porter (SP) family MFS transporter